MSEKELLFSVTIKDCRVDTFRAGGKGGQHQNKHDSGVRITHTASGAVGESREHRGQLENKRAAFRRMAESEAFKKWHRIESARRTGVEAEIKASVEKAMAPKNIKVEVHDEKGRWADPFVCAYCGKDIFGGISAWHDREGRERCSGESPTAFHEIEGEQNV